MSSYGIVTGAVPLTSVVAAASANELEARVSAALASLPADHRVLTLALSGGGYGHEFTVTIVSAAGSAMVGGLATPSVRCYGGGGEAALGRALQAALALGGSPIVDVDVAGAPAGQLFMGMIVYGTISLVGPPGPTGATNAPGQTGATGPTGPIGPTGPTPQDFGTLDFIADSSVAPELFAFTSPHDFAGCVAYFDMLEEGSFVEAGGFVTSIENLCSAVVWSEATFPPGYDATGLNGLPCMTGNGVNQRMISTEAAVWGAVAGSLPYTLFMVAQATLADTNGEMFAVGNSGVASNGTRNWGQSSTGAGRWVSTTVNDAGTPNNAESSATTPADTQPHVHCWFSPGTNASHFLDDGQTPDPGDAIQNPGTLTPDRAAMFCRPDSSPDFFFNGKLGLVALYNLTLEPWQRRIPTLWMEGRWAL